MKDTHYKITTFLILVLFCFPGALLAGDGDPEYIPGEFVVVLDEEMPPFAMAQTEQILSANAIGGENKRVKLFRLTEDSIHFPKENSPDIAASYNFCADLKSTMEHIALCEPNFIYRTSNLPNDPLFSSMYGLHKISAPDAWSITTGSKSVVVAVLDTGIDYQHPDLADNMWINLNYDPNNQHLHDGFSETLHGASFVANVDDMMDDNGHGTHVAGVIGAVGNNNLGLVGVNWNVSLMGLKFLNKKGGGSLFDAVQAIDYAVERGAHVINASWGGPGHSTILRNTIKQAGESGVIFIAAAGNSGQDITNAPFYPASYNLDNVIAVAASNASDKIAPYSGFSKSKVHLAAPGSNIKSTLPGATYGTLSGTSMAAPFVAGAAALLYGTFPDENIADIKNRLLSGDHLDSMSSLVSSGSRLNVYRALLADADLPNTDKPVIISSAFNRRIGQRNFDIPLRAGYKVEIVDSSLVEGEQIRMRFRSRGRRCILGRATVQNGRASLTGRVPRGIRGRPVMMAGTIGERVRFASRRQCVRDGDRRVCRPRQRLSRDNYRSICREFRALVD